MMSLVSVTLTCVLVLALLVPSPSEAQNPPATESQADPIQEANQLNAKGVELYDAGRYPEAEPLIKRALAIWESALGPNHINVAACVDNLARVYSAEGQYAEAEKLQKRALAIQEKALGINSPPVAESLNNLAGDYHSEGRYAEAEPLYKRALAIRERSLGPDSAGVAETLNDLAQLYLVEGRYTEAEPLFKRAINEKALGRDSPDFATCLDNLAALYHDEGRYAEAEPIYKRALAIRERSLGPDSPEVARSLNNLAVLYRQEGRYTEAEPLFSRVLASNEKAPGHEGPEFATYLNNLATMYHSEGRYDKAEVFCKRALAIDEKALGPLHPDVAAKLNNLAAIYEDEDRHADAEPLFKRALAIWEKALGANAPEVAVTLNNLAGTYDAEGRYADALPLFRRALAMREKALGPDHPRVALSLNNLAFVSASAGRYADAELLGQSALAINEKILGPNHPDVALNLNNLAFAYSADRKPAQAREAYERARIIMLAVERGNQSLDEESVAGLVSSGTQYLPDYAALLASIARTQKLDPSIAAADANALAFVVAEQARGIGTQSALAKAALRALGGDPKNAALARRVQDLENQYGAISKQLDAEYAKPAAEHDPTRLKNLQQTAQTLDRDLTAARGAILKTLPSYAELAVPNPIDLPATRKLLGPDEALVSYFVLDDRILSWLVLPNGDPIYRDTAINHDELKRVVGRVRASLAPDRPYDVADSFALYKLLLQSYADKLGNVTRLIIVPDRELFSIPFAALATSDQDDAYKALADDYHQGLAPSPAELHDDYPRIAWLAKQNFSLAILPSATSLRLLRQIGAAKGIGTEPLIGIGDPTLHGKGKDRGGAMLATRGGEAIEDIRQLPRLPGTRDELLAEARALAARPDRDLFMQDRATRATVMSLDRDRLANARVVSFATHALTGGALKAFVEPALVLTPPTEPSPNDNGLLELADIMGLHLGGSEWVVLSACNTANGGDGLSGLVRGFFFAGAPALLVSQWSVNDEATDHLMTELFHYYATNPRTPRADALRHAMLALMSGPADANDAFFAHPFAWAPFVLVGDGGKASR